MDEEALAGAAPTELRRDDPDQKVTLSIGAKGKAKLSAPNASAFGSVDEEENPASVGAALGGGKSGGGSEGGLGGKGKPSAIASLIREETKRKEKAEEKAEGARRTESVRKDYWLVPELVVKVMNKQLKEGKYYKQKGTVETVGIL